MQRAKSKEEKRLIKSLETWEERWKRRRRERRGRRRRRRREAGQSLVTDTMWLLQQTLGSPPPQPHISRADWGRGKGGSLQSATRAIGKSALQPGSLPLSRSLSFHHVVTAAARWTASQSLHSEGHFLFSTPHLFHPPSQSWRWNTATLVALVAHLASTSLNCSATASRFLCFFKLFFFDFEKKKNLSLIDSKHSLSENPSRSQTFYCMALTLKTQVVLCITSLNLQW